MKTPIIPLICSVALSAMIVAATTHWWSLRQFSVAANGTFTSVAFTAPPLPDTLPLPLASTTIKNRPERETSTQLAAQEPHQKDFYEALIQKMASVETQNRDLLDQLAETNRDLMKLEFRVDTHSESFRPLPVSEDKPFSSLNDEPLGVLPPRAEPVVIPSHE